MAKDNKNLLNEAQITKFMKLANLEPLTPGFVTGLRESEVVEEGPLDWAKEKLAGVKLGGGKQLGARHGQDMADKAQKGADESAMANYRAKKFAGTDTDEDKAASYEAEARLSQKKEAMQRESHGRGRGEGDAGYGSPDANTRLEEQDELEDDMALDVELGDEADMELADDEMLDEPDMEGPEGSSVQVSIDDFLNALERALEDVLGDEVEVSQEDEEVEVLDDEGDLDMDVDVEEEEEIELQEKKGDDLPDAEQKTLDKAGEEVAKATKGKKKWQKQQESLNVDALVNRITARVAKRIVGESLKRK